MQPGQIRRLAEQLADMGNVIQPNMDVGAWNRILNSLIYPLLKENICTCGQPGEPDHTCPYQEEINGDSTSMCNCCAACQQECAWDV
jgi:hypothetical protein